MDKLGFLTSVEPDDLQIVSKSKTKTPKQQRELKKKNIPNKRIKEVDVENIDREDHARTWEQALNMTEALPVKFGDKVVRTVRPASSVAEHEETSDESSDEEQDDVVVDGPQESDNEFETPSEGNTQATKEKTVKERSLDQKKLHIADICHAVTTDPTKSLRKKRDGDDDDAPRLSELLAYLQDPDFRVQEVAMLSCLLVFKDICPGYRIRTAQEFEPGVVLKKETKRLRDFELALLGSYQFYVKRLDSLVQGLGSVKRTSPLLSEHNGEPTPAWQLGVSALRCQCELMRSLAHFNLRSQILSSIVARGSQPLPAVSHICCSTIRDLFRGDSDGELSFELVTLVGKCVTGCKYEVPEEFMRTLEYVKLTVHADSARDIRRKAKQNRRKRKRQADDVEAGLQEVDASAQKITTKRFQADSLHEVCIIYFRVIKMKVGFRLLPAALEGLGRITHLMNIDMVEDLIALMKTLVDGSGNIVPDSIQLLCVHCALSSLAGPGQELGVDDEAFVTALRRLMIVLPTDFTSWNRLLECVELCLLKRREARNSLVLSFVRLLLVLAPHMAPDTAGAAALTMAHCILLRYPRARFSVEALVFTNSQRDDDVGDLAMQPLKQEAGDADTQAEGDGTWILPLLSIHCNARFHSLAKTLSSKNIVPLPLRVQEAVSITAASHFDAVEKLFSRLPPTKRRVDTIQEKPQSKKKVKKMNRKNGAPRNSV